MHERLQIILAKDSRGAGIDGLLRLHEFCANEVAVRAIHDEPAAYLRPSFVYPAIHVCTVDRNTPAFGIMSHDMQPIGEMCCQVRWNLVLGLENNGQATAQRVAS